ISGLRIERADLGDHVEEVLLIDAANTLQRGNIAFGDEIEPREERLHGRVEAVTLPQLDGKAFAEIARADACGVERLDQRQHALNLAPGRAEPLGYLVEIDAQIAGLIDGID